MDTTTAAGWENVAIRMETIGQALEGYRRTLEEGSRKSLRVARRQVLAAIQDARIHAGEDSYFGAVADRHRAWRGEESSFDQRIEAAALVAREAFADFARYLENHYLADAPVADGVGLDRYMRHARRHLGMDIDPQETYRWGWTEVASLHRRMIAVAAQIDPGASLAAVVRTLKTDPSRSATDPGSLHTDHDRTTTPGPGGTRRSPLRRSAGHQEARCQDCASRRLVGRLLRPAFRGLLPSRNGVVFARRSAGYPALG